MTKVLHICNDFSYSPIYKNLYIELDKLGVEQIVFHPVRKTSKIGNNSIEFSNVNSKIVYSKQMKNYHRFFFRSKIKFLYNDLLKKVNVKDVNVIHATTLFSDGAVALKLYKKYNIPYIVNVRSTDVDVFLKYRPDLSNLCSEIINNAMKVVFISPILMSKFLGDNKLKKYNFHNEKFQIINNGIDDIWINNKSEQKLSNSYKFLYVGQFIKRKQVDKLISNLASIRTETNYNITLTCVGGFGDFHEKILSLIEENSEWINYTGYIKDKNELLKIYREHDFFVMFSSAETFGLSYLEALSQGLTVGYVKKNAIDGLFPFKVGGVSNSQSDEDIQLAIKEMILNRDMIDLNQIDFDVFRWRNIVTRYMSLYNVL